MFLQLIYATFFEGKNKGSLGASWVFFMPNERRAMAFQTQWRGLKKRVAPCGSLTVFILVECFQNTRNGDCLRGTLKISCLVLLPKSWILLLTSAIYARVIAKDRRD